MIGKFSKDKSICGLDLLKDVGYILLLITFFIGVIMGSCSLKMVDRSYFEEYANSINEMVEQEKSSEVEKNIVPAMMKGIKVIFFFWIVGLSIIGALILVVYIGYKGYSLGYTLSALIYCLGVDKGNDFIFHRLFFQNAFLIFILIYIANASLKIAKKFLENGEDLKQDVLKYTGVNFLMIVFWMVGMMVEKKFFY